MVQISIHLIQDENICGLALFPESAKRRVLVVRGNTAGPKLRVWMARCSAAGCCGSTKMRATEIELLECTVDFKGAEGPR